MADLTLLGTSSGVPTRERNQCAAALRFDDGRLWIFDTGEAVQHRILTTPLSPADIDVILISHLHGDHVYGLPGLLCAIQTTGRTAPITLVAPQGIERFLAVLREVTDLRLSFAVHIQSLQAGIAWNGTLQGRSVKAIPVQHRVPSFAFVIQEPERQGELDAQRLIAAGLPPGPIFAQVKRGIDVTDNQGRVFRAQDFVGPRRPGRVIALVGDTMDASALAQDIKGADLLLHEATYDDDHAENAKVWQHSTAAQAAAFAASCQVKRLVLTHLSSRHTTKPEDLPKLLAQAQAAAPGLDIILGEDLQVIPIPLPERS